MGGRWRYIHTRNRTKRKNIMVEKTNKLSMSFSLTEYEEYIPFHTVDSSDDVNVYTKIYDIINFINETGLPDRKTVLMNDIPLYYYEKAYGILHITVDVYNSIIDGIVDKRNMREYDVFRQNFESILNRYITDKPAIFITAVPAAKYNV